jgi:hypothetical protein
MFDEGYARHFTGLLKGVQTDCFAQNKIATGALLSWFLNADTEVTLKALDAAKDPKIDNRVFAKIFHEMILGL